MPGLFGNLHVTVTEAAGRKWFTQSKWEGRLRKCFGLRMEFYIMQDPLLFAVYLAGGSCWKGE